MFNEIEVRGRTSAIEQRTFENVIEQGEIADRLGYDSAWFVEHHFTKGFSHCSAPEIVLGSLTRVTSRIRLGFGVVLLPFAHPVRTAERVATLDVLSGGRVEFGTGRGASPLEYKAFKRPFEQSRDLWEDNLDAILKIWNADGEPVSIDHELWEVPDVAVFPRPVQRPHPPVWVASTSLDGFIAAARRGLNLMCMPIVKGLGPLSEDIAAYKAELEKCGYDPAAHRVAIIIPWHVASTRAEASRAVDSVIWYIRRQVNLVIPPGKFDARHAEYRVMGQLAAGLPAEEAMELLREERMVVVDDVAGTQAAIRDCELAGATDIICQFQVGGLAHEHVVDSMELFAKNIIQQA